MVGRPRHEVHLAGKTPTQLADKGLFSGNDDDINPSAGRYYLTKSGLPYAISVPAGKFEYPIEGKTSLRRISISLNGRHLEVNPT